MLNIRQALSKESAQKFDYEDEKIRSNLYLTSLSYRLRSLAAGTGLSESARMLREQDNQWLKNKSEKIENIPVINLDALKELIDRNRTSCDAFFYNAGFSLHKKHFLGEFKNTQKSKMLEFIASDERDGIKSKVLSSLNMLRKDISFSGTEEEKNGLEGDVHLFLVYGEKNDVASDTDLKQLLPKGASISRGHNRRQNHASRQSRTASVSRKRTNEILTRFSDYLERKGFSPCSEKEFPGDAIPETIKSQGEKIRYFSMFSAYDFATVVNNGYFDTWEWGDIFKNIEGDNTSATETTG